MRVRQSRLEQVMKVVYDPETDILRLTFNGAEVDASDEARPGVVVDCDPEGERHQAALASNGHAHECAQTSDSIL